MTMMMHWLKDQSMMMMTYWSVCDDDDVLIKRSEYDDDDAVRELKYDDGVDHDVTDQDMMILLIEITKC